MAKPKFTYQATSPTGEVKTFTSTMELTHGRYLQHECIGGWKLMSTHKSLIAAQNASFQSAEWKTWPRQIVALVKL